MMLSYIRDIMSVVTLIYFSREKVQCEFMLTSIINVLNCENAPFIATENSLQGIGKLH